MDNNNYLGYYAKDKFGNLFQFKWDENDNLRILVIEIWIEVNKKDYEIVEIKMLSEDDK